MQLKLGNGILGLVIFLSAMTTIYLTHLTRERFATLQALHHQRDALHIEWTQLLLEQGTWASYSRIEQLANKSLHMQRPDPASVQVIKI